MCAGGQLKDAAVQEERAAERELLAQAIQKQSDQGLVSDVALLCGCSLTPMWVRQIRDEEQKQLLESVRRLADLLGTSTHNLNHIQ